MTQKPEGYHKEQYQKRKASQKQYYREHKAEYNARSLKYIAANPERVRQQAFDRGARTKHAVLSHYGLNGQPQCCWPDCTITDSDMLSLDHIANDGALDRARGVGGIKLYRELVAMNYPEGFQTLCHNHQWKKELMRRRQ
jgi:hypothetical protein